VTSFVIEADGASRGNPGHASYGTVIRNVNTGEVILELAGVLGHATNNVAEYNGLIAGLEAIAEIDPNAIVEVRMDSKLVVEQMSGRWQIKSPDMRELALRARELLPYGNVTYTWIPREDNKHADALANEALDSHLAGGSGKIERRP
jgi:probable phosphoglycerate mutase